MAPLVVDDGPLSGDCGVVTGFVEGLVEVVGVGAMAVDGVEDEHYSTLA